MLNLSDKDLDHLSREAAEEHNPGDIIGPRSWDKLEVRLDRDLGRISPNTPRSVRGLRGIRRLPFYYAPAVMLLLGISYYFVRQNRAQKGESSGSPPLTVIKSGPAVATNPPSSSQNPEHTDKSNSTPTASSNTTQYPAPPTPHGSGGPGTPATAIPGANGTSTSSAATSPAAGNTTTTGTTAAAPKTTNSSLTARTTNPLLTAGVTAAYHNNRANHNHTANGHDKSRPPSNKWTKNHPNDLLTTTVTDRAATPSGGSAADRQTGTAQTAGPTRQTGLAQLAGSTHELSLSKVRGPLTLKHPASIDDSALRAFNAKTSVIQLAGKKGGLHINRSLQFGLVIAPDFSSVNSVAGDKAGSTIGLTVDYQFASHWYAGTGLLISRKNYAANPQNYHVPSGYYANHGIDNVDLVKGSFSMLEIPLNLRYDFSTTGNTMFFATAGVSSYIRTSENCDYYYSWFGRQVSKGFQYSNQPDYLFSAINLSVGVETGISNSLSLLIAPYMKIPSRNIGFGQVEMSSVGINFALKFAPVISRKRR